MFHRTRMTAMIAALLTALPVQGSSQSSNLSLNPTPALVDARQLASDADSIEANADTRGAESVVRGVVIAKTSEKIGLLQYDDGLTNAVVIVYQCCAATALPVDRPLAAGDEVIIWYSRLPDDERLASHVLRPPLGGDLPLTTVSPESSPGTPLIEAAPSDALSASEADRWLAARAEPQPKFVPGPPETTDVTTPQPETTTSEPAEEDGRFSFGKVVGITREGITVREYDFGKEADTEVVYRLLPETEYGNLDEKHPLQTGDDVVLDYEEVGGQRFITTLVREEPLPVADEDQVTVGTILSIIGEDLTVREYDRTTEADAEVAYQLLPETKYQDFNAERPLRVGDSLILTFREIDGQRHVGRLFREGPPPIRHENWFSLGKVIGITDAGLTVREYDFAREADVEVIYQLVPGTEYGNLGAERPLQVGDDVVVDYQEIDGRRCVTTLVREVDEKELLSSNEPESPTP